MSAGSVIDSVEFAGSESSLSGEIAMERLDRLRDALFDLSGRVRYALDGFCNREGKASLRLRVDGGLKLTCQRCLGPVDFVLETDREFVLTDSDQDLKDVAEESALIEHIPADSKLDVEDFVESEILLELPLSPLHRPEECNPPQWGTGNSEQDKPFGALEALKRNS